MPHFSDRRRTPTFGVAPKSRKTSRLDRGPRLGLPLSHASHQSQKGLFPTATTATRAPTANLSLLAREYLKTLGLPNPDTDAEAARLVWVHSLAIGLSPAYLHENADGIRHDWPRIPQPDSKDALLASAALGKRIAALLDTETPTEAIEKTSLQRIAAFKLAEKAPLDESKHFAVTAGWDIGLRARRCLAQARQWSATTRRKSGGRWAMPSSR